MALEAVAKEADCTDKQKQKLEKSKGAIESMIAVLVFFLFLLHVDDQVYGIR